MTRNITTILAAALLSLALTGCITEYTHPGTEDLSGILVVDGAIISGTSTIKLSMSVGINDDIANIPAVSGAIVKVVCDDGTSFTATGGSDGTYKIDNGPLSTGKRYKLTINIGSTEYESTFLTPMDTPELEYEIVKESNAPFAGNTVKTYATIKYDGEPSYYRWHYEETWETTAELMADGFLRSDFSVIFYGTLNDNPYYYCWKYATPSSFLLQSTKDLTGSEKKVLLAESPSTDDRYSNMYHIKITQYRIRREAFDYFSNLQKNIEDMGSIFAPIPSEMKGNITCVSDPETLAIGYVEVSASSTKDGFLEPIRDYYDVSRSTCEPETGYGGGNWLYMYIVDLSQSMFVPRRCVDCRAAGNGTKVKPPFWPNDHK